MALDLDKAVQRIDRNINNRGSRQDKQALSISKTILKKIKTNNSKEKQGSHVFSSSGLNPLIRASLFFQLLCTTESG
jgi:hypothetical protein